MPKDTVEEQVQQFINDFTEPHEHGRTMYARHLQPTERMINEYRKALTDAQRLLGEDNK